MIGPLVVVGSNGLPNFTIAASDDALTMNSS